jgi:hypothetical protein
MTVTTLRRLLLAGFALLRRAPLTVLSWGLCLLPLSVLSTLLSCVYDGLAGPWSYVGSGRGGWMQFGVLSLNLLVMCFGMAILAAAVFRAVADPERTEGRWMRLGADELRLGLVWGLMFVTVFTGAFIAVLIVAATARDSGLATKTGTLVSVLVLAMVLLARFSLTPAVTAFERRVGIAESWRLTRKHYGLAVVCALFFLLVYGGGEWLLTVLGDRFRQGGVDAKVGYDPLVIELARYAAKPENLVPDLARVLVGTLAGVIAYAPMAVLYRDLAGRNPADQAAVFD